MSTTQTFVVPGTEIKDFTFTHLGSHKISNPKQSTITPLLTNLSSVFINEDEEDSEIILPPITSARLNGSENKIQLALIIFNNYIEPIKKDEVQIKQNFTIGTDGTHQLNFYVFYTRTPKITTDTFRADMITFDNVPIQHNSGGTPVDINIIDDVMGVLINTNPKASRGTVTTVKSTN